MTGNLDLWTRFEDIDPKFTKPITGKPYKGTSPNPHYVIRCLTEMFGPVGVGFGWEVKAEGFQPMGEEFLHWCRIRFWHGDGPGFEAYGQTKAMMKTRNGMMLDEDAPKKSMTDAITKAAAQIGVGANIFLGRWDDSRYVESVNKEYRDAEAPPRDDAATRDRIKAKLERSRSLPALEDSWRAESDVIRSLPSDMQAAIRDAAAARKATLNGNNMQAPPTDHVGGAFGDERPR